MMVRPPRHPWMRLLPLSLSLALLGLCALPTVSAFYGVAVPVALTNTNGTTPVPNADCIFVYKCAPLGTDELDVVLPSTTNVDLARPVYVGRAAGRCQRRLDEIKCALKRAVMQENECRAPTWPDLESAVALPTDCSVKRRSTESCIVQQCQGQQLVVQYYLPTVTDSAALRALQIYSISNYSTSVSATANEGGCNTEAQVEPIVVPAVALPNWTTVVSQVKVGPFGKPADTQPPSRTCSDDACGPVCNLPAGLLAGTCNVTVPVGFSCTLDVDMGYTVQGASMDLVCHNGVFAPTTLPTVHVEACNASSVAAVGLSSGSCGSSLSNGTTCTLALQPGYALLRGSLTVGCLRGQLLQTSVIAAFDDFGIAVNMNATAAQSPGTLNVTADVSTRRRLLMPPKKGSKQAQQDAADAREAAARQAEQDAARAFALAAEAAALAARTPVVAAISAAASSSSSSSSSSVPVPVRNQWGNFLRSISIPGFDMRRLPGETGPVGGQPSSAQNNAYAQRLEAQLDVTRRFIESVRPDVRNPIRRLMWNWTLPRGAAFTWGLQFQPSPLSRTPSSSSSGSSSSSSSSSAMPSELYGMELYGPVVAGTVPPRVFPHFRTGPRQGNPSHPDYLFDPLDNAVVAYTAPLPSVNWAAEDFVDQLLAGLANNNVLQQRAALETPAMLVETLRFASVGEHTIQGLVAGAEVDYEERAEEIHDWRGRSNAFTNQTIASLTDDGAFHRDAYTPEALTVALLMLADRNRLEDQFRIAALRGAARLIRQFIGLPGGQGPSQRRLLQMSFEGSNMADAESVGQADRMAQIPVSFDVASAGRAAVPMDVNGDGFVDMFVRMKDDAFCGADVYLSFGAGPNVGRFTEGVCLPPQLSHGELTYGDFDGDGNIDYLVRNATHAVHTCALQQYVVFFSAGDGSVTTSGCVSSLRWDPSVYTYTALRLDQDLRTDWIAQSSLLSNDPCPSHVTLVHSRSTSDSPFYMVATCLLAAEALPLGHVEIIPGDLNGDGMDDLFFTCSEEGPCGGCPAGHGGAFVSLGNGTVSEVTCFPEHFIFSTLAPIGMLSLQDINADGRADVITTRVDNDCQQVTVYLSTSSFTSALEWSAPTCSGPVIPLERSDLTLLTGDVNGDGNADVLLASDYLCPGSDTRSSFWLSDGVRAFGQRQCMPTSFASGGEHSFSALLDANGDSLMDIVTQSTRESHATILFVSDMAQFVFNATASTA